jgi:hypothetical protein
MLVYLLAIWYILRPFTYNIERFGVLLPFWYDRYIYQEKSGNPAMHHFNEQSLIYDSLCQKKLGARYVDPGTLCR